MARVVLPFTATLIGALREVICVIPKRVTAVIVSVIPKRITAVVVPVVPIRVAAVVVVL
jgi:hypothetical protein